MIEANSLLSSMIFNCNHCVNVWGVDPPARAHQLAVCPVIIITLMYLWLLKNIATHMHTEYQLHNNRNIETMRKHFIANR